MQQTLGSLKSLLRKRRRRGTKLAGEEVMLEMPIEKSLKRIVEIVCRVSTFSSFSDKSDNSLCMS